MGLFSLFRAGQTRSWQWSRNISHALGFQAAAAWSEAVQKASGAGRAEVARAGDRASGNADLAQRNPSRRLAGDPGRGPAFFERLRLLGLLEPLPLCANAESDPRSLRPGQLYVQRPVQWDHLQRDLRRRSRPDHRHRRRLRRSLCPQRSECLLQLLWPANSRRLRQSHFPETQPGRRHVATGHRPQRPLANDWRQRLGVGRVAGHRVGPRRGALGQHHPLRGQRR